MAYNQKSVLFQTLLGDHAIAFQELRREVETTIGIVEKVFNRTQWLAREDAAAVCAWIDAHKKAAESYKQYIDERTRRVERFILKSKDSK